MRLLAALALASSYCATASSTPILNFAAGDYRNLQLGEPVTVGIELTGVDDGDSLELLAVTVSYESQLFDAPQVTPGSIVPDPLGMTTGFQISVLDVIYDSLSSPSSSEIRENGDFVSLQLTPIASGSGAFQIAFVDAIGTEANGAAVDGAGAGESLPFTIVIPEPTSFGLVAVVIACSARRQRRATRHARKAGRP